MHQRLQTGDVPQTWVDAELRLVRGLDSRMIGLLRAIAETGSINRAASLVGLSYKGAWQMIERANNLAPKALITTATGGSKGGGTKLTSAGQMLVKLFDDLEQRHRQFLDQLNKELAETPDLRLLLNSVAIKTSAINQLSARVITVVGGAVNAEVVAELKGGTRIVASLSMSELKSFRLTVDDQVLLLINPAEIFLPSTLEYQSLSARNHLTGEVIRLDCNEVECVVVIQLPGGDTLTATSAFAAEAKIAVGDNVLAVFKGNAVLLACQ